MYFCTAVDVPLFRPALLQWFNEDVISPGSLTVISSLNLAWLTLYRLEDSAWELNSTSGGQFKMSLLCLIIILFFNYLKKKKAETDTTWFSPWPHRKACNNSNVEIEGKDRAALAKQKNWQKYIFFYGSVVAVVLSRTVFWRFTSHPTIYVDSPFWTGWELIGWIGIQMYYVLDTALYLA